MATVQLFASYAEHFGSSALEVPISHGSTARQLMEQIRALPNAPPIPRSARIAVNHAFAADDRVLSDTDEIALIPPVAGG